MRKIISIFIVLLIAAPAFAQQLILQGSTAYPLGPITIIDSSDHIAGKTGCTPSLKKISKGFASAVTPSGTWTELDATNFPGVYYFTGNATDTNTVGLVIAHITCSGADPFDKEVGQVVTFDPHGATLSGTDIGQAVGDTACSGLVTSGTLGYKGCQLTFTSANKVDANVLAMAANVITAAAIATDADAEIRAAASPAVQKNVAKEWPFKMVNSTTGLPMTSGTPTCQVSIDAPNSFGSTFSGSAVSSLGLSEVTLSGASLNGTYYTILHCTLASANDYLFVFSIQP